jgi:hypothetical protein
MLPYWLLLGIFAIGALVSRPDLRRDKPIGVLIVAALILVVMIGLRDEVGVDWENYLRAWNAAPTMSLPGYWKFRPGDPVFYAIMWQLSNWDWPYWSLNLICAVAFTWGLIRFARQQPNAWLAVAVAVPYLVIVIAMSGIRQATAIGFIFLALASFRTGSTKGFLLWTLVASLFHASAIVVLPFAGLSLTKNRFQSLVLLVATGLVGYFVVGSTFDEYSRNYLGRYVIKSSGTVFRIWMSLIPAIIYLLLNRRLPLTDQERSLWRNFSLLAVASVPLVFVVTSTTALDRLLLYAFPLQIMVLAWLPYLFRRNLERLGTILLILVYLGLQQYVFFNYAFNRHSYVPYRNVLLGE